MTLDSGRGNAQIANRSSSTVLSRTGISVDAIDLRFVRMPLLEPFETSFGVLTSRLVVLVGMASGRHYGWGEIVAWEAPLYSYETAATVQTVISQHLSPLVVGKTFLSFEELASAMSPVRGHPMAKAGIELAFADLAAKQLGVSLSSYLGGVRSEVPVGVSLGIQASLDALLDRVERYSALGYQRIKLKIKPLHDIDPVAIVRQRFPNAQLSVDANAAYTLQDGARLRMLDQFGLSMIEQPLQEDDIVDHAALRASLKTEICLDESITSLQRTEQALGIGSCGIINIKVGRVGGYAEALSIHDLCVARQVPVWCGGMLESGIGRLHNVALASLPGFSLPGDLSASSRYFARDLVTPHITVNARGCVEVPQGPGIGAEVDMDFLVDSTERMLRFEP